MCPVRSVTYVSGRSQWLSPSRAGQFQHVRRFGFNFWPRVFTEPGAAGLSESAYGRVAARPPWDGTPVLVLCPAYGEAAEEEMTTAHWTGEGWALVRPGLYAEDAVI